MSDFDVTWGVTEAMGGAVDGERRVHLSRTDKQTGDAKEVWMSGERALELAAGISEAARDVLGKTAVPLRSLRECEPPDHTEQERLRAEEEEP